MKADSLTLASTLNSPEVDFYTIPQYQRPYTWSTQNFETLWEDLMEAYESYLTALKDEKIPEFYFLGPIVFVKNTVRRSYDIIDGQQRCTTFHVMLWYLHRQVTDETEQQRLEQILTFLGKGTIPKLKVSGKDAAAFQTIMTTDADIPSKDIKDPSKIAECAKYFRGKVKELKDSNDPNYPEKTPDSFSAFLRDYTQFIVIVAENYVKAWDLFIGLNGKGVPLNPTDLVKASVCGNAIHGSLMGDIWEDRVAPLKTDSSSFLLFLCRHKAQRYVAENNLFKEFEKLFNGKSINKITPDDISALTLVFHRFWIEKTETLFESLKFSNSAKKAFRVLRDLERRDFTTLIFQYAEAFGQTSIFDEDFLKLLASYQIRMAISRKKSRESNFVSWFKDLKFVSDPILNDSRTVTAKISDDKREALLKIAEVLKKDAPDDAIFEGEVKIASYGKKATRIILRHYEEGSRGTKTFADFELEHLMPQTGTSDWFSMANVIDASGNIDKDSYESIVNNIGNLFICDSVTNKEARNKPFNDKKARYQDKLKDWSIARITLSKTEWKLDDIQERASQIAKWAKDYWKL